MGLRNKLNSFLKDESGRVVVEMVLWLPVFFACFILVVDVSLMLYRYTFVWRVIEDANRERAVSNLTSDQAVIDYISGEISGFAPNATIESDVDVGRVYTAVTMPAADLKATTWFASLTNINIHVESTQYVEPWE